MGNIQQTSWGFQAIFFRETYQELEDFAERLVCIIAGAAVGPVNPEHEPRYTEEPQCCPTHTIGVGACAQGAAGNCFSKSSLRLTSKQSKHSLPQELSPGHLCKDREPSPSPSHLLCAEGLVHLAGKKGIPLYLLVLSQDCPQLSLLRICHKLCPQQDSRLALGVTSPHQGFGMGWMNPRSRLISSSPSS